jgi:hypothetical protein
MQPYTADALRGLNVAVGPRGIRALQVIFRDGTQSPWFGRPVNTPITERLRCSTRIVAFGIEFDVSLSTRSHPHPHPRPHPVPLPVPFPCPFSPPSPSLAFVLTDAGLQTGSDCGRRAPSRSRLDCTLARSTRHGPASRRVVVPRPSSPGSASQRRFFHWSVKASFWLPTHAVNPLWRL